MKPELPLHIDSTMINAARSCGKKFDWEFNHALRPAYVGADLHAGATFSGTLEYFYKLYYGGCARDVKRSVAHVLPIFEHLWGSYVPNKPTPKSKENMWAAFEDYIRTYPPESDHVQPFFQSGIPTFEYSFAIPLTGPEFPLHPSGSPFIYCGRPDLLGHWQGKTVVRDEKTSARLDANWASKWDLRSQFLGYCWALSTSGIPCDTVVVRGVIIRMRDIQQVEAIKSYAEWEIKRWYTQLSRDLHRLVSMWKEDYFDYSLADACTAYGGCPFLDLCKSPSPERWFQDFRKERWNPLLRNPIDPTQDLPKVA